MNNIIKRALIAFTFILTVNVAYSQLKTESSNVSLYFLGGYSNFIHSAPESTPYGFVGGGLGAGYEYHVNKFYMNFGLEIMSLNSATVMNNIQHTETVLDTEGEMVHYSYRFNNWTDYQYSAYFNIPIILGYQGKRTYFGFGVKFGLPFSGASNSVAKYKTAGVYDKYIGDFIDMPNHFYTDYVSKSPSEAIKLSPNLAAIFEIGSKVWESKPKSKNQGKTSLKIGMHAEYGFLNVVNNSTLKPLVNFSSPNASIIHMSPMFSSLTTEALKSVNPFFIGVKATLLFEIIVPKRCSCLQTKKGLSVKRSKVRF